LRKAAEIGFQLPKPGDYAVGALFMPKETGVAQSHHEASSPTRSRPSN